MFLFIHSSELPITSFIRLADNFRSVCRIQSAPGPQIWNCLATPDKFQLLLLIGFSPLSIACQIDWHVPDLTFLKPRVLACCVLGTMSHILWQHCLKSFCCSKDLFIVNALFVNISFSNQSGFCTSPLLLLHSSLTCKPTSTQLACGQLIVPPTPRSCCCWWIGFHSPLLLSNYHNQMHLGSKMVPP